LSKARERETGMKKVLLRAVITTAAVMGLLTDASAQDANKTLNLVKQRGLLACGVGTGVAGFSAPDDKGIWYGLDVDFCRALAAAVLGDPLKVTFKPLTAKERFTALQSGEIDVLARNTTWTISRDSSFGFSFAGVNFYDGQGFLVKKSLGIKSAKELKGASICVQTGTTTELNLADFFRTNKMDYTPVVFERPEGTVSAFDSGRCDAMTTDVSALFAERLRMKNPDENVVLPEVISKEPLGPLVRQGDGQWFTIVKWVHFAMLNAEEFGITQANVDKMESSSNPEIKRLLGKEGEFGKGLGLENDWVVKIIKAVGNYGESYDRNVGKDSRLKIDRGLNRLWNLGGLHYAPTVR
jgi:general L-amino acid transport system substrate-binding protein